MRKIVCGVSRPKEWMVLSELIMWWEETFASHAYFYIKRDSGIHLLYQAVGSGTEFMGYKCFTDINEPQYEKEIEITDEKYSALIDYLIQRLKTKYSIKHLIGLFYKRAMLYWFNKKVKNPFKDKNGSQVCVEALIQMLNDIDIYKTYDDPEDVGMKEVIQILLKMPGKIVGQ